MARGRPVLATLLITTGVIALAVPGLDRVRGRVPRPERRLPASAGAGRSSARSRSCSPPCTSCASSPPSSTRTSARPSPTRRSTCGRPRSALVGRSWPSCSPSRFWPAGITDHVFGGQARRYRDDAGSRSRCDDLRQAGHRLGGALARSCPPRRRGAHVLVPLFLPSAFGGGLLARLHRGRRAASAARCRGRNRLFVHDDSGRGIVADAIGATGSPSSRRSFVAASGLLAVRVSYREPGRREADRRVLRAAPVGRRRHGLLRRGERPHDALPRARVVLDLALHPVRDRGRAPRRRSRPASST